MTICGIWDEEQLRWTLRWRRSLFEWQLKQAAELISLLTQVNLGMEGQDKLWRNFDKSGIFLWLT